MVNKKEIKILQVFLVIIFASAFASSSSIHSSNSLLVKQSDPSLLDEINSIRYIPFSKQIFLTNENSCSNNASICGTTTLEVKCLGNNLTDVKKVPNCIEGSCIVSEIIKESTPCPTGTLTQKYCLNNQLIKNITTHIGCINGNCTSNTQSTSTACPTGNVNLTYCLGNLSVIQMVNYSGCVEGSCKNNSVSFGKNCPYGCSNGICNNQTIPKCGNRVIETNENCDDGNLNNNDGCSSKCRIEFCGDYIRQSSEQCDDGNIENNDGCNAQCYKEYCGNDYVEENEQCEPPNTSYCDSYCHFKEQCIDSDKDGVCDSDDKCPNSKPHEEVDYNGCDIFQFCSKHLCGFDCTYADWHYNEKNKNPKDCKVIIPLSNGVPQQPRCVPTEKKEYCAN